MVTYAENEWNESRFKGHYVQPAFDKVMWRKFVTDNNLKREDVCISKCSNPLMSL